MIKSAIWAWIDFSSWVAPDKRFIQSSSASTACEHRSHNRAIYNVSVDRQLRIVPDLTRLDGNPRVSQFFVSLNGPASVGSTGDPIPETDRGERCAASRAFNGSSPTANLVSIIKVQGMS